jgi:exopolyphosphatase/guanosine-5'-triphosphate,3'-diphosphate pyrophosphatase
VAHTLPDTRIRHLVVDIGGGSTEFIIGQNIRPELLESLYMGCVSYSLRFFPQGNIDKRSMKEAELAARRELQLIVHSYRDVGWDEAVGSSGTAKAIFDLLESNGFSAGAITMEGLDQLRSRLVRSGNIARARLSGMRADRMHVIAGGVAIMSAVFREFGLTRMTFSEGALRLGVLYDLLGRYHHEDLREATVNQFMQRYEVDRRQAERVGCTALDIYAQLRPQDDIEATPAAQFLRWAARLHEVGVSVAHSSYHKHSAYILANADMPGFSKRDQALLAQMVLAHRGRIDRVQQLQEDAPEWLLIFCLRMAALLHRARDDAPLPRIGVRASLRGFELQVEREWIESAPLTAMVLTDDTQQWANVGIEFRVRKWQPAR